MSTQSYQPLGDASPSLPYLHSSDATTSDSPCEPVSPLDPYMPTRSGRETQETEFFSAVYLDSPSMGYQGGTRPLRVRKKVIGTRIAGVGPASRRRRRSTVSVPQSPRSPRFTSLRDTSLPASPIRSTRPSRSNTLSSTSTIHPYHSISRIFLNQSPILASPVPPLPTQSRPQHARRNPSASSESELHLGLGGFTSYDESAHPGPSPPLSPAPSPTKRAFVVAPALKPSGRNKTLPPSPMTPSRAPPKAAALLGAGYTTPAAVKTKKKEHYRPLPTQTLVEIERFFGEVPRKGKKGGPHRTHRTPSKSGVTRVAPTGDGLGVRNVGEGSTVRHKAADGSMWLDVEEEQEFAWLMSEIFSIAPLPLPPVHTAASRQTENWEIIEEKWGMASLTSVLSMAKPTTGAMNRTRIKKERGKEESFMDFGKPTEGTTKASRKAHFDASIHPWANPANFAAPIVPPPRSTSHQKKAPSSSSASSGSETDLPTRSESPPRIRNRPPPLTLRAHRARTNLPVISDTPSTVNTQVTHSIPPAPALPPVLALPISNKTIAAKPAHPVKQPITAPRAVQSVQSVPAPNTPFAHPRRAPIPGYQPLPMPTEEVSYFEPDTPMESKPKHKRVLSGGATAVVSSMANAGNVANKGVTGVKSGGAWLRKVVKQGVRA